MTPLESFLLAVVLLFAPLILLGYVFRETSLDFTAKRLSKNFEKFEVVSKRVVGGGT